MEAIEIVKKIKLLKAKKKELLEKINDIDMERQALTKECMHDIVFKYHSNHPTRILIDGNYYCPVCEKIIRTTAMNNSLDDTSFEKSKVIDLTSLSLVGNKETLAIIRREVISNLDFYYDKEISDEELAERMVDLLKTMDVNYRRQYDLARRNYNKLRSKKNK